METTKSNQISTKYLQPVNLDQALNIALENESNFKYIAGGTDVSVNRFQENEASSCLIDITGIHELESVVVISDHIKIGSLVKLNKLSLYEAIVNSMPALIEAANSVGSPLIRKSATLGGNVLCENRCLYYNQSAFWRDSVGYCLKCEGDICIATGSLKACYSEFVSDTAPVLISLKSKIEIHGSEGIRTIPLEDIYTGDGVNPRNLNKTDILTHILVPLSDRPKTYFRKLRLRDSMDFTSLTVAISLLPNDEIRLVMAGVDPKPVVVDGNKQTAIPDWIKLALKGARAIDNDMMTRLYRRDMIRLFVEEGIRQLLK